MYEIYCAFEKVCICLVERHWPFFLEKYNEGRLGTCGMTGEKYSVQRLDKGL